MAPERSPQRGFTLVELLLALAIATVLLTAIGGVIGQAMQARAAVAEKNDLVQQTRFAMQRMLSAVRGTSRLMIPLAENPATAWSESVRDPGVLAVTLDPTLDRDGDGFADADNDKDGLVDEDLGDDNTNNGKPGIAGIDDDGDGQTDEKPSGYSTEEAPFDNDEDDSLYEDWLDGLDNDGDGAWEEDIDRDMDCGWLKPGCPDDRDDDLDGSDDEEWFDPVVFYLNAGRLIERTPNLNPTDGTDYSEQTIAENVTLFRVERVTRARAVLVDITLELTGPGGESIRVNSKVRVGGVP